MELKNIRLIVAREIECAYIYGFDAGMSEGTRTNEAAYARKAFRKELVDDAMMKLEKEFVVPEVSPSLTER